MSLDTASKEHRLKTMEVIVLDNSLRETSVVQIRGHVLKDKCVIAEAGTGTGIGQLIVASFGNVTRVDDLWLLQRQMEGKDRRHFFFRLW